MKQLGDPGQRKVWKVVKGKFDGILEDDIRAASKAWCRHNLSLLDRNDDTL